MAEAVVGPVVDKADSYISEKFESATQLEDRCKLLDHALNRLLAMKEDNEKRAQRHKHKDTTSTYKYWTNTVSKIAAEANQLINTYDGQRIPKWKIWKRSEISKKIAKMHNEIVQLQREYARDFLVDKMPEPVLKEFDVPQITEYPTLRGCLNSILGLLKNNNIKTIGVCGTKGVGKTTILRNLNNNEEVAELFDMVIYTRVGSAQTIHELQRVIAERLMVDNDAVKSPGDVAGRISMELENKKYLLILDDIVNPIKLEELGIPPNNNGSKVVMATQFPHVLKSNQIERIITVEKLLPDEARKMFQDIIDVPQITEYPTDWPEHKELYWQRNANLTELPSIYFEKLHYLSILDLSYSSISDLPDSLFDLGKLKELYLRGCELLMELPPEIKRLKTLEMLDLAETQITHLPGEIQELTNLQSLTVCFYGYDQSIDPIIPGGVLSKLAQLSYLSIDVNPDDKRWDENVEVILPEIAGLRRLKTLVLYIPRVELLKYMPDSEYVNFQLVVGDHKKRLITREPPTVTAKLNESERTLRFVYGSGVPDEINEILGRTEAFFLDRHTSVKSLSEFEVQNIWTLSVCIVAECNEMEMLVDGCLPQKNILFFVEFLSVYYIKNLESIWRGPAPSPSSFRRLKYLALQTCPKLTTIFTLDFLDNLSMLEELIVEDCPKVSTLISRESSEANEKHFLCKLRKLLLVYLPEMDSISNGLHIGESLEIICFYYCPKLRHFSPKELSSKELKVIKGETKWWEELKWNPAEWGKAGRPNKINNIFSPINEEADVMSQLEMTNF